MEKVKITYHFQKGSKVIEQTIELTLDKKRHEELERMDKYGDTFAEIKSALEILVSLQNGRHLKSWGYEISIDTEEGDK